MRVLATGISGFVGPHLVAELIAYGHEVHGMFLDEREPVPDGVAGVHYANVTDLDAVRAAFGAVRPEWVVHLAGASSVGQSFQDPIGTWHVNLNGTLAVLEALRLDAPQARCLTVTSGDMYGRVPEVALPVGPETPIVPLSPYGASKAAADFAATQYCIGFGLDILRVRAFNHIGPGQDARFVLPSVARQVAVGEREGRDRVEIHVGNLDTRRDFTDVRDVMRAYRLLMEHGSVDGPYLVCSGHSVPIREVVDRMVGLARVPTEVTSDPTLRREGEQPDLYGSPDRLRADTGWVPEIPLDVSLRDTLDWWRDRVAEED